MPLTVGMLGLSHPHTAMYLRTFDALARVGRVAMWDPDPAARERGAAASAKAERVHAELDELLGRADVPLVLVALPNDATPAVVARAAEAGKDVICEKPCARSADELRPALAALERRDRRMLVAYMWRANPSIQKMRELVQAGALGRLTSVELRMVTSQVRLRDPSHWLFKREVAGGGVLAWLACHWLDVMRYLTGDEVASATGLLGTVGGEAIDVEDVASVALRLRGGALVTLHAGYLLTSGRPGYEGADFDYPIILRGTEGTLTHGRDGAEEIVTLQTGAAAWRAAPRQVFRYTLPPSPAYGGEHGRQFFDEFIGGAEPRASGLDALRVLEILDAVYRSAATERTVHLDTS
ncbi:MAG TPA: Gfo/Idh/MocA family oxidoreductase [Chloroflexota bacterium]|jgi:predicted dehydrogenase